MPDGRGFVSLAPESDPVGSSLSFLSGSLSEMISAVTALCLVAETTKGFDPLKGLAEAAYYER